MNTSLKRIKCSLTGGHRLNDMNLQVVHDAIGYHFINYCVKCGKMIANFMPEAEMNDLIEQDIERFKKERSLAIEAWNRRAEND